MLDWLKKYKVHIIYSLIILLILCGGLFSYNVKSKSYQKLHDEKVKSEERIKFYEQGAIAQKVITDSLKNNVRVLERVVEYQNNNQKLIVEKYNEIRGSIKSLNADKSILFFSNAISKESGN